MVSGDIKTEPHPSSVRRLETLPMIEFEAKLAGAPGFD